MAADQRHVRFQYSVLPPELRHNVLRYTTPADTYALSRTPGSVALVSNFYIDMERALFGAENDPPLNERQKRLVQRGWRAYDYGCYLIQHAEETPHHRFPMQDIVDEIERRSARFGRGLRSVDLWIDYDPVKLLVAMRAAARVPGDIGRNRFLFLVELFEMIDYTPYFQRRYRTPYFSVSPQDMADVLSRVLFHRYVTDIALARDLPPDIYHDRRDWSVPNLVRHLALAAAQAGNFQMLIKFFDIDAWQQDEDWADVFDGADRNTLFNATQIIPQSKPEYSADVKRVIRMLENDRQMYLASPTLLDVDDDLP